MGQKAKLTVEEATAIQDALFAGDAERAFAHLAAYLKTNEKALSDATLRFYIEEELFDCCKGRGQLFADLLDVNRLTGKNGISRQ